jgi:DNA-binding XRE family transcriptional regulator
MKTLDELRKGLSPERRRKIDARTAEIIAEHLTLQELRKARNKTQAQVAETLGITQDQVSRLEQRTDLLISTLRKYIEGMGGRLSLVAEFPNKAPVRLEGIAEIGPKKTPIRRLVVHTVRRAKRKRVHV